MDEDETYQVHRVDTLYEYYQGLDHLGMQPLDCVAHTLQGMTALMPTDPKICVATVVTLSIVSVREGFLPDYLDAMLSRLGNIEDLLDYSDKRCYWDDLATLEALRTHVPYTVVDTDTPFLGDLDSLLPDSVLK